MPENKESIPENDDFKAMAASKRLFLQIISTVLFGFIIWGVVAGTDFIMNFLKGLIFKN